MSASEDEDLLNVIGDYKHGSIRRVRLTNFLTYSSVEFEPGPRLNMVVGPNGTGKSTILCAICLGLGGEPRLLGRASEVETFVMNGETEGEIEVEIEDTEGGNNPIIRRQIRREGSPKSNFFWNDSPIKAKAVREICLKKYQITIDNLCTFLPQDKVGSFSGFDSKQLLIETEKSLSSSQHLFHTHQELITDQEELQGGTNKVETLQDKLQQLQAENSRLEREKQRMEERQVALEQADLLRKKLYWLQFDKAREEAQAKSEIKKQLKQDCTEAQAQVQPVVDQHAELKKQLNRLDKDFTKLDKDIHQHQREMEKQTKKYETHDDQIENCLQELMSMESQRTRLEDLVHTNRANVENYLQQLADCPKMETLHQEQVEATAEHKAVIPDVQAARAEMRTLQEEEKEVADEKRRAENKWTRLQDEKARRQEKFFRQEPKLKKIYDWVQDNRTKFRKEVIGPIACEVTPKSNNAAAYLEQHVSNNTLKSFVVQDKADYDFLYNSVRKGLKLPINIMMVREIPPPRARQYSEQKMQVLVQQHGITGYLDESFTAAPVVVQAIRASAAIDKVLVGTEKTQHSLDNDNLLEFLAESERGDSRLQSCCLFAASGDKSFKYTSNISKYSGKPSLRVDDVRPARWLAPGVSDEAKQQVQQELKVLEQKMGELQPALQATEHKVAECQEKAQNTLQRVKAAKENITNLTKVINKRRNAERKLKEAEDKLSQDNEEEKKHKISALNKRIRHSLLALDAQGESYKHMIVATVKASGARLNKERIAVEERQAHQEMEEAQVKYHDLEQKYIRANAAFKEARRILREMKSQADDEAPVQDEDGNELPLYAQMEALGVESVEEAEAALEEAEGKANSIVADPNVIRQYEARKQEMEKVQATLDDLTNSKDQRLTELRQKVQPWEESLEKAVVKVDGLFSKYMGEMGFTGEVRLAKGNPSDDAEGGYDSFKEWGIETRVSFREGVKPQVLSARVQSGGERSVSTIMYLMALQDMMVAPFRCVDEINQGLDDRNERLVFRRIVENSCRAPGAGGPTDHSGQYFLITPKLLPNLYDMEEEAITVLCIFNGPYTFKDANDWDVPHLLDLRKRSFEETEAADEQEKTVNNQDAEDSGLRAKRAKTSNGVR